MKKIISQVLLFMIMMILTACGAGVNYTVEETPKTDSPEKEMTEKEYIFSDQEVEFNRDGKKIYGELYVPECDQPMPLVILSHGYGENHTNVAGYAQGFAKCGISACIFDFAGGSNNSKSDGDTTEMSVLTEAADLETILDELRSDPRFDRDKIFLFGQSQGGFVSTYVAGKRPDAVAGLIALYPAYVIGDDTRKRVPDPDNIPETMDVMGMTLGSIYNRDALSFDIYDQMRKYDKRVLIFHGTKDSLVPISYSERAEKTFPDAKLIKIEGADHGFSAGDAEKVLRMSMDFVRSGALDHR